MDHHIPPQVRVPRRTDHWPRTDFGLEFLATIYERLFVDDEWAVVGEREFTWWMHDLPQVVRVSEPAFPKVVNAEPVKRVWISAETVIASDVDVDKAVPLVTTLNGLATQSAIVVDTERRELISCLRLAVSENDADRLVLIRTAIALQAAEATRLGHVLDWKLARRPHPSSGERVVADELIDVPAALAANTTDGDLGPWLFPAVAQIGLEDDLWVDATHDEVGLTAEIPWCDVTPPLDRTKAIGTALFRMRIDQHHPVIGRGVLLTLELPPLIEEVLASECANQLNLAERLSWFPVSALGAWTVRPVGGDQMRLSWCSFIPAVELLRLEHPEVHLLYQGCDARNRTASMFDLFDRRGLA